jgi:hypothetical protein
MWAVRPQVQPGHASAATSGAFAALLVLSTASYAVRADWTPAIEAGVRHDSNVGNAQPAADIVPDSVIHARVSIFQLFPLSDGYSMTLGGDTCAESFHRLDG